jgi:L-ribulose-5-phosphate 3-epimerase
VQRIGTMQGRLLPPSVSRIPLFPRDAWADEFPLAASAELDCIEWIYDVHGEDVNPLATDAGIDQLKGLAAKHGVGVFSVCANYFMDRPLLRAESDELENRLQTLLWLLRRAAALGASRIVLPLLDASRIGDETEMETVVQLLRRSCLVLEETGVELHLETSLDPRQFAQLLAALPHPKVLVAYDSGNSASLGYDPREEFAAYGNRIGSVHIKDRVCGGGNVPLGTGNTDFPAVFDCLRNIDYRGDFVLEVTRGPANDEIGWARRNRAFVERLLHDER